MKHSHTHKHIGSCADIYRHLCENLDAKLENDACREIRKRIDSCENCTALLDSLKKTVYLYREYPTPELPAKVRSELFAVIRVEKGRLKKTVRR